MRDNDSKWFQNKECEYYPCHKMEGSDFNCLFCYCPLYPLGDKCEGDFIYLKNGVKDCSNCLIPHREEGYEFINERFEAIDQLTRKVNNKSK